MLTSDFQILSYNPQPHRPSAHRTPETPITVLRESTWTHIGPFLDLNRLPPSFNTWAQGTFDSSSISLLPLLAPFLTFLHIYLSDNDLAHYSLTIRAQKATTEYDVPRWHFDREVFQQPIKHRRVFNFGKKAPATSFKLAAALVGPGTLFLKDGVKGRELLNMMEIETKEALKKKSLEDEEHICRPLRCLGCADMAEAIRFKMAEVVKAEGLEVIQIRSGEVAIFKSEGKGRDAEGPAMHSEPSMSGGDRVFVHAIPGREEELRGLVEGWGMEFPRDWAIGVPEIFA